MKTKTSMKTRIAAAALTAALTLTAIPAKATDDYIGFLTIFAPLDWQTKHDVLVGVGGRTHTDCAARDAGNWPVCFEVTEITYGSGPLIMMRSAAELRQWCTGSVKAGRMACFSQGGSDVTKFVLVEGFWQHLD